MSIRTKLKEIGLDEILEKDIFESVVAYHSKAIQAEQAKTQNLQTELDETKAKLEKAETDLTKASDKVTDFDALNEELAAHKQTIAELQGQIKSRDINEKLITLIKDAGGRSPEKILKLIDTAKVEITEEGLTGAVEQIEALAGDDTWGMLFQEEKPRNTYETAKPVSGSGTPKEKSYGTYYAEAVNNQKQEINPFFNGGNK